MTSDNLSQVMTPREVAQGLKVSEKTVARLLRTGQIAATKVGGQWRITTGEYNRILEQGIQPKPKAAS